MTPKPCVSVNEISSIWGNRKDAIFNQDGLIFMPVDGPVRFGKHDELLKWKDQHTIDVRAELRSKRDTTPGKRSWNIFIMDGKKLINVSEEEIIGVSPDRKMRCRIVDNLAINSLMNHEDGVIVECSIEVDRKENILQLYPIRHRSDKIHPNSIVTVQSTIKNVVDHIHIEDLLKSLSVSAN